MSFAEAKCWIKLLNARGWAVKDVVATPSVNGGSYEIVVLDPDEERANARRTFVTSEEIQAIFRSAA